MGKHNKWSRIRERRPEHGRFLVEGLMHGCNTRCHGLGRKAGNDRLRDCLNHDAFASDPAQADTIKLVVTGDGGHQRLLPGDEAGGLQ